jgi:hypothetical protein
MVEIKKSYCGLCHPRCGTLLHIEDGRIVKVTGDPDHPVTRGAICERGRLMPDHVHHPQRLNHPLKRKGEKGGEQWPKLPDLFGVFESNANILCPDDHEFCSPEIGSWPHSALMCRIEKEEQSYPVGNEGTRGKN